MKTSLPSMALNTRRTFLRPLKEKDVDDLLHLHLDDTTRKYAWVENLQTAEANSEWIKDQQHLYRKGMGLMAIESHTDGRFLGLCGLRIRNDLQGITDITYRILPEFRLMGFATESAKEILNYGFRSLHLPTIIAQVHRDNFASRRIMYRLGFETQNTDKNWIVYRKQCDMLT